MAWTAPRTWVAAEVVTAALMNAHLRDNLKAIGDPWTAYTPTWAATTNPAIGNGQISCAYMLAGKLCAFRFQIAMGTTTTYGTGGWTINLPFIPTTTVTFPCELTDTGVGNYAGRGLTSGSSTTLSILTRPTVAGAADRQVTSAVPFTWGTGDVLSISGVYETT